MSSLIKNKVKTNRFLTSVKLFIVPTILCATVQTYTNYTTIITKMKIRYSYLLTTFLQATLISFLLTHLIVFLLTIFFVNTTLTVQIILI